MHGKGAKSQTGVRGITHGTATATPGCVEIRSSDRNRIVLVTPLSSEDYRSITKRFAVF